MQKNLHKKVFIKKNRCDLDLILVTPFKVKLIRLINLDLLKLYNFSYLKQFNIRF